MNGHLLADENHIAANVIDDNAYAIAMAWWHYIINDVEWTFYIFICLGNFDFPES